MNYNIIETEKCLLKVYTNAPYLEHYIKEGASINEEDVIECKKRVVQLRPGIKFYVLSEGIHFFTLNQKAREICATPEYSDNTFAIAFHSTNVSVLLLGEMYNKINKPAIPTRMFYDRGSAKEWLIEQMKKNGDDAHDDMFEK